MSIKNIIKRWVNKQQAGLSSDPDFFGKLDQLPNPNPILRKTGDADKIYSSILNDAHVIGEVRSIRGAVQRMDYRLITGDEDNVQAQAALDLCNEWMTRHQPNDFSDWHELMWQFVSAILTGYTVHEMVWDNVNGKMLPIQILDRPNSRFGFNAVGELLLHSKTNRNGAVVKPGYFIVSQNMPTVKNPYGEALLSSCFWPWTFKTGGFKYFVKYCERHGLPWAIGRYPAGTSEPEQKELEGAISSMLENAYAVVPEGTGVELLTTTSGGKLPQQALISLCNNEMSKALTGQAMVAEIGDAGARAASETAQKRQYSINDSDRKIAVNSMNQILRLITTFNFGEDVPAPKLEFFKDEIGGKERAEVYQLAAQMGKPSLKAMHEELGIPIAENEDDLLRTNEKESADFAEANGSDRYKLNHKSKSNLPSDISAAVADGAIEANFLEPISEMLDTYIKDGKSIQDFMETLPDLFGGLSSDELLNIGKQALSQEVLKGVLNEE